MLFTFGIWVITDGKRCVLLSELFKRKFAFYEVSDRFEGENKRNYQYNNGNGEPGTIILEIQGVM